MKAEGTVGAPTCLHTKDKLQDNRLLLFGDQRIAFIHAKMTRYAGLA
jgi:hypothetical protein